MYAFCLIVSCCLPAQAALGSPAGVGLSQGPASPFGLQPVVRPNSQDSAAGPTSAPAGAGAASKTATASGEKTSPWGDAPAASTIQPPASRNTPAQMVAELLRLPAGATITGRPLTLLEVLSSSSDRRQQLQATHDYWRLAAALAEYRFAWEEKALLDRIEAKPADAALLRTARISAEAGLRTAELAAVAAQHRLAEAAMLPVGTSPPLPADLPHVGSYRTYFDQLFGSGIAPGRTRLIHRVLPVRLQAIEARVASVEAAEQAVTGTAQAYQGGAADLSAVLSAMVQWGAQRRALMAAVRDYNHDIAEYALAVASPLASSQTLVAMLIKTSSAPQTQSSVPAKGGSSQVLPSTEPQRAASQPSGASPSGVQAATFDQPVPQEPARGSGGSGFGQPTLAPPQPRLPAPGATEPTLAPPQPRLAPGSGEPTPAPAQPGALKASDSAESKASEPTARFARRLAETQRGPAGAAAGWSAALAEATPAARAKHLALALHADRASSVQAGESIDLERCLQVARGGDRRGLIDAYWLARQRAAECQAWTDYHQMLDQLVPAALARRDTPAGPAAMLRLQAARQAALAEQSAAQSRLLEASFELTRRAGRAQEAGWLMPTTVPHCGPYQLHLDAQPRALAESWRVRRLAAAITAWPADLQDRAAAVLEADTARAAAAAALESLPGGLDRVLVLAQRQQDETLAFLSELTAYNQAIAEYATAVLPAVAPADQLARTLVVGR